MNAPIFTLFSLLLLRSSGARLSGESVKRELLGDRKIKLKVTNLSYQQPFSGFFVMVHNKNALPLFNFGDEASPELAELAENGNPGDLEALYEDAEGVLSSKSVPPPQGNPLPGGQSFEIEVTINKDYPLVTLASMAVNTNDCFVAINGGFLYPGRVAYSDGLDAGSEENNELCSSIPGPACPSESGNVADGEGEGFVHVHRGFHGVGGELSAQGYDWRNPMMKVEATFAE